MAKIGYPALGLRRMRTAGCVYFYRKLKIMLLRWTMVFAASLLAVSQIEAGEQFKLPPEVTPALRAACEADVRRLCIGENPSVDSVKRCVEQKYAQLGARCKVQLVAAGLGR